MSANIFWRDGTVQKVACTSASTAISSAFGDQTRALRLTANTACHVKIGDGAQTADTDSPLIPANREVYVAVSPGQRLAAIRASTGGVVTAADGHVWVTELTK